MRSFSDGTTRVNFIPHAWRGFASALALAFIIYAGRSSAVAASDLTWGHAAFVPGTLAKASVPLSAQEQAYASEGGNAAAPVAIATLLTPRNFTPTRTWPVLLVFSSSDGRRRNADDLSAFYGTPAAQNGWVALAGDSPQYPRTDSAAWRVAFTLAAIDELHRSFPASRSWPVVCAGFSGGARRAAFLAPLLSNYGLRIAGLFLTGMIDDRLTEGYAKFQPGRSFLDTPVFISSGRDDKIATLSEQETAKVSLQRTGFRRVRFETFPGPHSVKLSHFTDALRWFSELAR